MKKYILILLLLVFSLGIRSVMACGNGGPSAITATIIIGCGEWSPCSAFECGTSGVQTRTCTTESFVQGEWGSTFGTTVEVIPCSAPACPPSCAVSCTSWSTCSASCGGGTQGRTCTRSDCTTYIQTQSCNTQSCCIDTSWNPPQNTVCSGVRFTQTSNCGSTRTTTGTKYCCSNTSWSPATSTVCSGTSFTQTSNCGVTRTATGTKTCQASYCNTARSPYLYCSTDGNIHGVYNYWNNTGCSSGNCQGYWSWSSCGDFIKTRCEYGCNSANECNTCTPDCSCASNTCVGSTCSDGCGGTCAGTKTSTTWTPSLNNYCSGYNFTQTGSQCGDTRTATGTKTCSGSYCNTSASPYLYCSNNDVYGVYNYWNSTGCNISTCLGNWSYNSCGTYKQEECGSDTCNTSGTEYEYCQDGDVWVKYNGTDNGCASGSCYSNSEYCNHQLKEDCEVGYVCEVTGTNQAECVAKSASWTED